MAATIENQLSRARREVVAKIRESLPGAALDPEITLHWEAHDEPIFGKFSVFWCTWLVFFELEDSPGLDKRAWTGSANCVFRDQQEPQAHLWQNPNHV